MASPAFWEDNRRAQELIRERTELSRSVSRLKELATRTEDLTVLLELAAEADDGSLDAEIAAGVVSLRKDLDQFELKVMMSGAHDAKAAVLYPSGRRRYGVPGLGADAAPDVPSLV